MVCGRVAAWFVLASGAVSAQQLTNESCAGCHPAIARRFAQSSMANSSGRVTPGEVKPASFADASTGVRFEVAPSATALRLGFERSTTGLQGSRALEWFVGSGRIGRSYLFSMDGFLYQAPVSFYASDGVWRASPGFQRKASLDLTRAIEPACLQCHASGLRPVAGTQNRFEPQPFLQGGVSCERCHGSGTRHIAVMKMPGRHTDKGIVNPARLSPERRDSVCAQCHLTGAARVARAGKDRSSYKPGDLLSDHVAVLVWSNAREADIGVTSHFEKLSHSRCKEMSGDRLWCGTCHDPHGETAGFQERTRSRCVSCHHIKKCSLPLAARREKADQCQTCHMPKGGVRDLEHAVYTDHSIPRRPRAPALDTSMGELVPFGKGWSSDRDSALAHAVVALTEPAVRRRAFEMLRAEQQKNPHDTPLALQLAQFYDRGGQPQLALPLLERATASGAANAAALINLGAIYAQQNRIRDAMEWWRKALAQNPALTQARLNLAVAHLRLGEKEAGVTELRNALRYDPDSRAAAQLLAEAR